MSSKVDKSYRVQDGCWNCKKIFVKNEYEGEPQFYCNKDNDRPKPCGSCLMDESFGMMDDKYDQQSDLWEEWAKNHSVDNGGICDKFEKLEVIGTSIKI